MVSDTEPTAAAVTVLTLTKESFKVEQCSAVFLKLRLCCHHKDINAPVCLKREFAVRSRTYGELAPGAMKTTQTADTVTPPQTHFTCQ